MLKVFLKNFFKSPTEFETRRPPKKVLLTIFFIKYIKEKQMQKAKQVNIKQGDRNKNYLDQYR